MFIKGERVVVEVLSGESRDPLGAITRQYETVVVDNVLVGPSDTYNDEYDVNGTGHKTKYSLFFPKWFNRDLHGAKVTVRGERMDILGDPASYTEENVPGSWNLKAVAISYGE